MPAVREVLRHWKKRSYYGLIIAGFITMLIALWSMFEPGFHKGGVLIMDFAQGSFPAQYISEPAILKVGEIKDVTMVGCWPRIQGDNVMATRPGDLIPVRCSSNIYIDGQKVMLKVFYRIEEYGGDHTVYSGARTMVLFENSKPEYNIRTVALRGSRLNSFLVYSEGTNLDFKAFDVSDSYWEHLEYRVDSEGDNDLMVGIRGRLTLDVILENNRFVRPADVRKI